MFKLHKPKIQLFTGIFFISMLLSQISLAASKNQPKQILNLEFRQLCQQDKFSGAILVAANNHIMFEKSCGLANRSFNAKNTLTTKFNLASVGKIFTSIAIAQLIQQHKITLNTPIYQLMTDWLPSGEAAKKITVQQLLTHTSGLGNYMSDPRWKLGADSGLYVNVEDYKPLIKDEKLLFEPGTSQLYSNNGYLLLGAIIEKLSGMRYKDYIQKNIFTPAQMKNTGIYRLDADVSNLAVGYIQKCSNHQCNWKNNYFEAPFVGNAAGGSYSTIGDLFLFIKALHHNKLASAHLTHQLLTVESPDSSIQNITIKPMKIGNIKVNENFSPYGFAGLWNKFGLAIWNDPDLIGHTGGIAGASAFLATTPDGSKTIIILSNIDGSEGTLLLYQKARALLGFSEEVTNY